MLFWYLKPILFWTKNPTSFLVATISFFSVCVAFYSLFGKIRMERKSVF
jgi:hypothetical protein